MQCRLRRQQYKDSLEMQVGPRGVGGVGVLGCWCVGVLGVLGFCIKAMLQQQFHDA